MGMEVKKGEHSSAERCCAVISYTSGVSMLHQAGLNSGKRPSSAILNGCQRDHMHVSRIKRQAFLSVGWKWFKLVGKEGIIFKAIQEKTDIKNTIYKRK